MSEFNKISRIDVQVLDEILGKSFKVLDDGFVRVLDYMGSDQAIVQAARVSYGEGTKRRSEDRGLIRYLMRHGHTTPFEMCEIKFHIRVPMDCWRQWIRHRTANVNEYSTRYSIAIDSAQKTNIDEWRKQSEINKQGSGEYLNGATGKILSDKESLIHQQIRDIYEERISYGVAREQARKDLPLSTYTEAYWKIDLHNLFHFLSLRMDGHSQFEIRNYAQIIGNEIVSKWCPIAWEAFVDYKLNSLNFSAIELTIIKYLINSENDKLKEFLILSKLVKASFGHITKTRELIELEKKIEQIELRIDWANMFQT